MIVTIAIRVCVCVCLQVFTEYFKSLEEESIRDNFVIIYELLDELMDFGYPQSTDPKILQSYITQTVRIV
jgi:AP-1 complex subunit mu